MLMVIATIAMPIGLAKQGLRAGRRCADGSNPARLMVLLPVHDRADGEDVLGLMIWQGIRWTGIVRARAAEPPAAAPAPPHQVDPPPRRGRYARCRRWRWARPWACGSGAVPPVPVLDTPWRGIALDRHISRFLHGQLAGIIAEHLILFTGD